jgi:hypothetical protein
MFEIWDLVEEHSPESVSGHPTELPGGGSEFLN